MEAFETHEPKETWEDLAAKLPGHYSYYGVSGNSRMMQKSGYVVIRVMHQGLNRRSHEKRFPWKRLNDYLKHYPLPRPRPGYRRYQRLPLWEAGTLHVRFCEGR